LLEKNNFTISTIFSAGLTRNEDKNLSYVHEYSFAVGLVKSNRLGTIILDNNFSMGHSFGKKPNYYCSLSNSQTIKIKHNIIVTSFNRYCSRQKDHSVYAKTLYQQLSLAKQFDISKKKYNYFANWLFLGY
jgi:hypothetical protein